MLLKIHNSYRTVIAVCDTELVGKFFEEGIRILDVRETFYRGEEIEEKELVELMIDQAKEDATFNIIGEKSTQAAIKAGLVREEGVGKVQNIPFALVLM